MLRDRASRATKGDYVRPKAIVHTIYGINVQELSAGGIATVEFVW